MDEQSFVFPFLADPMFQLYVNFLVTVDAHDQETGRNMAKLDDPNCPYSSSQSAIATLLFLTTQSASAAVPLLPRPHQVDWSYHLKSPSKWDMYNYHQNNKFQ